MNEPWSEARHSAIQRAFEAFDARHPEVYAEFKKIARQLKATGRKRYGAGAICEVIRYHRALDGRDGADAFKINNNFRSRLARKLIEEAPEFAGFLETRQLKS